MLADKRKYVRRPCNDKIFIQKPVQDQNNSFAPKPIYLRDESEGGISGTYFGEDIPDRRDVLYLKDSKGQLRPVRLVWSFRSVEAVYMLGFKFENESVFAS
ncbi:MAG: hypothetical protein ACLFQB_05220 [Chitinispirillaceae bacterium]